MSTAGGKGESHCPGMFILPPAFIQGRIMQHHGSEATFAPTWRVCGGNVHSYIYTCTKLTGIILLIRSQVDCSLKVWRVGRSGAAAAGCTSVSLAGLGSLGRLEPVMLPVCAAQSSSSAQHILLGSVRVVVTCLINSALEEVLTSCQWFPALIVCVCVYVYVCEHERLPPSLCCGV